MIGRLILGLGLAAAVALGFYLSSGGSQDRADRHYQRALEHLEAGDAPRATIEFRNLFKVDGSHYDGRLTFIRLLIEQGKYKQAYSQALRLAEQYPEDATANLILAELALRDGDAEATERYGRKALTLVPEDLAAQAVVTVIDHETARKNGDAAARKAASDRAAALVAQNPELWAAHQTVVAEALAERDWPAARAALDAALAVSPDDLGLHRLRLGVLEQTGDDTAAEAQMRDMMISFPDQAAAIGGQLVGWYLERNRTQDAEVLLRDRAADAETGDMIPAETLVRFLATTSGTETAIAEMDTLIASGSAAKAHFLPLQASMRYDRDQDDDRARAKADLQTYLASDISDDEAAGARVALARIHRAEGRTDEARKLVDAAIEADPTNVAALKLRAERELEEEDTAGALVTLRTALGHAPRDPDIMLLLARTHERAGNRGLMADRLAMAAEMSGYAPDHTLRYASYLTSSGQANHAVELLEQALRLRPAHPALLLTLGQAQVETGDAKAARGILAKLDAAAAAEGENSPPAAAATALRAGLRAAGLEAPAPASTEAAITGIRSLMAENDATGALARTETALETDPGNPLLELTRGELLALTGQPEAGAEAMRALLATNPQAQPVWLSLYRLRHRFGPEGAADAVLAEALTAMPDNPDLLRLKADALTQSGDPDGAIAIYEDLYARNRGSAMLANNLASLLATYRDDRASLDRAHMLARRLRELDVPAFQDTYGWIAYRRGAPDLAVAALEPAAAALKDDPAVQYHLAMALAGAGREAEALERLRAFLTMPGAEALTDYTTTARTEITRLERATKAGKDDGGEATATD